VDKVVVGDTPIEIHFGGAKIAEIIVEGRSSTHS